MEQTLQIYDDSGFIGIVNSEKYQSFVHEDWELDQLLLRFVQQTNLKNCIIWSVGTQNLMTVRLARTKSSEISYREASTSIKVTTGELFLTNYTDLSMAAQFEDEQIPSTHNSDLKIKIPNGEYSVLIRQMFDPQSYDWENMPKNCFELIFSDSTNQPSIDLTDVIWWKDDSN